MQAIRRSGLDWPLAGRPGYRQSVRHTCAEGSPGMRSTPGHPSPNRFPPAATPTNPQCCNDNARHRRHVQ